MAQPRPETQKQKKSRTEKKMEEILRQQAEVDVLLPAGSRKTPNWGNAYKSAFVHHTYDE